MKNKNLNFAIVVLGLLLLGWLTQSIKAFPPTPAHVFHGVVRDEMGEPLTLTAAQIFLETTNSVTNSCFVQPGISPGENYRLVVPMDSGTVSDLYKPNALRTKISFRIKVKINGVTYLPIETSGNILSLGKSAGTTAMNLTLGVDSDGDGIPDAWEYALIQMLGGNLTLADITPNGDADGDGISNYNEYIAGTYAWDPEDGLKLSITRPGGENPVVEFFGIAGRTYIIQGTTNMISWTDQIIRTPAGDTTAPTVSSFVCPASDNHSLEVVPAAGQPKTMFYRVRVQ